MGDNVKVCVRVRPLNETEIANGNKCVVSADASRGCITADGSDGEPPKTFTFDHVFGSDSKQVDVYNLVARPIVDAVLGGYNGTIFAYGQTGTGKTFTMEGVRTVPELRGIIPNSFAHVFGHIARAAQNQKYLVRVSYLEIYQEEVRDLLGRDQTVHLEVKERPDTGVYVKDLSTCIVNNADDLDRVMTQGNRNRAVGATNMNAHSSRSHAIFTITIECSELGVDKEQHVRVGKLHLVDLAGSERQSKTGATGERLKEATKINLSLSTLGNVISALVDGKSTHIPYRNSKLTRLLQDSLGGNSKTLMIANLGPADYNLDESISTLRYANRAKNIKNQARINEDPKDALLRQFQKEIEDLKRQLEEGGEYEEGDEEGGTPGAGGRKKRGAKPGKVSKDKMAEIQAKIEADQRRLESERDMAAEEKRRVEQHLQQQEDELMRAKEEQDALKQRLEAMEKKIIVGGVNLLEKAAEQEEMLEVAQQELEERAQRGQQLAKQLEEKDAERMDIEERYNSLQEEATGKTKKLKKLWTMYAATRAEMTDAETEHQRTMEELLESIRQLSRELKLAKMLIDAAVPPEFQELIEHNMAWSDEINDWQLRCVAYTGNNMRKKQQMLEESLALKNEKEAAIRNLASSGAKENAKSGKRKTSGAKKGSERAGGGGGGEHQDDGSPTDLSNIYLAYSQDSAMRAVAVGGGSASGERSASSGKPKTAGKRNKPK